MAADGFGSCPQHGFQPRCQVFFFLTVRNQRHADGQFCFVPVKEYMHHSNTERIVILQIESPEALEHVEHALELWAQASSS